MVEKDEDAQMQMLKCWKKEKTAYENACSGCGQQQQQLRTCSGYNLKPLEPGVPSIRL
jgi:hypothetical protein